MFHNIPLSTFLELKIKEMSRFDVLHIMAAPSRIASEKNFFGERKKNLAKREFLIKLNPIIRFRMKPKKRYFEVDFEKKSVAEQ